MSMLSNLAHKAGHILDSKVTKIAVAVGATVLTGGIAAPAIALAATSGAAEALKPGGNLKKTLQGTARGAVEGAAAGAIGGVAGSVAKAVTSAAPGAISSTLGKVASSATALVTSKPAGEFADEVVDAAGDVLTRPPAARSRMPVAGPRQQVGTRGPVAAPAASFDWKLPAMIGGGVLLLVLVVVALRRSGT